MTPSLLGWSAPSSDAVVLLSVKPRFANAILEGRKTIELRRTFPVRHLGATVLIYASAPVQSIVGIARIAGVRETRVDDLAGPLMPSIGCDRAELLAYAAGRDTLMALELREVRSLREPLPRKALEREFARPLHPPVSYELLRTRSRWSPLREKLGV